MQCRDQESTTSEEINATIDNILEEDHQEKLAKERKRKLNERQRCEEPQERDRNRKRSCPKPCSNSRHIGVNQSKRFSIRVMEAIRAIGRQKESDNDCATACEIVDYVKNNFESGGDIEGQVRTALKRTCCQGFVKNEGKDLYSLVGPLACQLTKTQKSNANKSMPDESRCGNKQERSPRRKSPGCKRKNPANTKKSSETELSIPTSVEEDISREQAQRDITNLQLNDVSANATFGLSSEQRIRSPRRRDELNFDRSAVADQRCLVNLGHSTPRRRSPAREENVLLDAARNLDIDFADDDDDNESYEAPDEQQQQEPQNDNNNNDDDDDDDDDVASDDSALREIRGREGNGAAAAANAQLDVDRDRELKRWIRNCRKECVKRNFQARV